ncbi:MAG: hypothetical protein AAFR17_13865 [Pseudomonadota bacterium]
MEEDDWEAVEAGQILVPAGMPSVAQIPIPGSGGLTISFRTRGGRFVNPTLAQDFATVLEQFGLRSPTRPAPGVSTSTLFLQSADGRRVLRLDYGYNVRTGVVDYHWNQKGTHAQFGIADHSTVGRGGANVQRFARIYRHAGRGFLILGAVLDGVAIYQADNRPRKIAEVVGGWAGAWAGCKVVGAGGAWAGSVVPGWGNAIGGAGGCLVGGIGGYFAGSWAGGEIYDLGEDTLAWAEDTFFAPAEAISPDRLILPELG